MMDWKFDLQMFATITINLPAADSFIDQATLAGKTTISATDWTAGTGTAANLQWTNNTGVLNIGTGITETKNADLVIVNGGVLQGAMTDSSTAGGGTPTSITFQDSSTIIKVLAADIGNVTRAAGAAGVYTIANGAGGVGRPVVLSKGSASLGGTVTNLQAGTKTINVGTNSNAMTVSSTGAISGVDNGDVLTVADSGTATTTITTAALASGNKVEVNGSELTLTAAAGTNALTLTASADGASGVTAISGLSSGNTITWTTSAPLGTSVTVNGRTYVYGTGNTAGNFIVKGSGTASTLDKGIVVINSSATNNVYTAFEGVISISGGSAKVTANTGTSSAVTDLTAGASLDAKYATGLTVTAVAGTRESSTYTINGMTFTQGFSAANATVAMGFKTTASGATLIDGSAYLNGSGTVVVSNAAGTNSSTISSTKGDITITVTNSAAGTFEIGDLDNGDSFTVTVGTDKRTYTVSNGRLYDSNGTVSVNAFNASDPTYGSVLVVSNITAGTAFNADGTGLTAPNDIATNTNLNSSHGNLAPAADVTGRLLGVSSVTGGVAAVAAAMHTVTEYANGSYVHANGLVDSDSSNSIGTLNSTDNYYTYTASGSKGQSIDLHNDFGTTTGIDNGVWQVTGTTSTDQMVGNGNGSTMDGGAGNDTITAYAGDIALGGEGNDLLIAAAAGTTLSGGAGNDTLTAFTAGRTTLTGGDGSDVFVINDGTARFAAITDFDFANDVLYDNQVAASSNFASLTSAQVFADGRINLNNGIATVQASNGSYLVQVRGNDTKKQAVGWAGEEATSIDATSLSDNVVLIGDTNTAGDSLYGGSGADTIRGGAGDTVYGGAGKNQIRLTGLAAGDATRTVGVGTGKDTITGFVNGFDAETADKLFIVGELNSLSSTLSGGTLNLKSGDAAVQMNAATATSGGTEVLAGDKKAVFVASGSTVTVGSASYADLYLGTKTGTVGSALNASAIEDAVSIDLSNTNVFKNFTQVTGGQGNTTMIGGKDNETLIAGTGSASLYGGAGKDSLVGNSTAKDTFFMLAGGGSDTVSGFTYYNGDNSDVADVVNMSAISSAKAVSGGVQLNVNDTDKILISGANANSAIGYQVGDSVAVAKVGSVGAANSFTYLKDVNYYGGGNKVDTLSFASGDSDNHQVWLDGSKGVTYASVDVVNGASASGDLVIAGDSAKNTIIGGTGNNSLWGGSGDSADTLRGGTGTNTFFYGLAEGNDTITCGTADDVVNLYNVKLSDVKSGEITNSVVSVELQDGSKLTVNTGSRDIKFNLASGESYTANHSTHNWDA